ncbi:DUF6585 family protein [Nocardia sp. NPDC051030]|uniref:DUF6585 family protein n=1 Tax=Nocardia sp. NPDC051030 TaxID=3155162 RepID=UPI003428CB29
MRDNNEFSARSCQVAERAGLGQHFRGYGAVQPDSRIYLTAGVVVTMGVLMAMVGFAAGIELMGVLGTVLAMVLGGRLMLWDVPWLAGLLRSNHGARLDWYEHGIVVSSRRGVRAFRFDSMRVWRRVGTIAEGGVPEQVSLSYRVGSEYGDDVVIPVGLTGREQWGPALLHAVVAAQLPGARARLEAGDRLDFGPFRLSRTAMGGELMVLWHQVREITVHEGLVAAWGVKGGRTVLLQAYPSELVGNLDLFWLLTRQLRAV